MSDTISGEVTIALAGWDHEFKSAVIQFTGPEDVVVVPVKTIRDVTVVVNEELNHSVLEIRTQSRDYGDKITSRVRAPPESLRKALVEFAKNHPRRRAMTENDFKTCP
jgi:hypothetical protein